MVFEANYFVAEFLMPTAILKHFSYLSIDEIVLLFGVSETAAQKKYDRVFKTTYSPKSRYDARLVRNFYNFLETGVDEAIYRAAFGLRTLKKVSMYGNVRRRCTNCTMYISNRKSVFCKYCGERIKSLPLFHSANVIKERIDLANVPENYHPPIPKVVTNKQGEHSSAEFLGRLAGIPTLGICEEAYTQKRKKQKSCSRYGVRKSIHRR